VGPRTEVMLPASTCPSSFAVCASTAPICSVTFRSRSPILGSCRLRINSAMSSSWLCSTRPNPTTGCVSTRNVCLYGSSVRGYRGRELAFQNSSARHAQYTEG
jgi:hypothetical protein